MHELLRLENLSVTFPGPAVKSAGTTAEDVAVLRRVSFALRRGESLALVGESGCGKSMSALAILGLLPATARVSGGKIELDGSGDLLTLAPAQRRELLGRRIGMVFQDAGRALNPVLSVGFQLTEGLRRRQGLGKERAKKRAVELLDLVAMPDPKERIDSYPHELSGGQQQRVLLAMALACEPEILLLDEPTTGLDVTIQAQILDLLARLRRELGLSLLLITHDLGVVAGLCDRVVVMYAGEVVEVAPMRQLFAQPLHPYTQSLLAACPRLGDSHGQGGARRMAGIPGQVPEMNALPPGCCFAPRCSRVMASCIGEHPALLVLGEGRQSRCFLPMSKPAGEQA